MFGVQLTESIVSEPLSDGTASESIGNGVTPGWWPIAGEIPDDIILMPIPLL